MLLAWATVAISLGAAMITGAAALTGSLGRGKQERALQLHRRRIEVAGEFSTSARVVITQVRHAVRLDHAEPPPPGEGVPEAERELL